jgi:DNA-binding response OmpR family regulator
MRQKILVVEDEKQIARFIELELRHEGYEVLIAHDGLTGLDRARYEKPDLVLLDLMLPGMDGFEVCRKIREFSATPVIMLTAKDATADKVSGLDTGANDYITKPFEMDELLARIRAAFRSGKLADNVKILKVNDLEMDLFHHSVKRNEQPIAFTKREYELLEYLMKNEGLVLTRQQILDSVWGIDYTGDANVIDVYIRYLRSKIDDPFEPKLIHTVRGFGYVLEDKGSHA